MKTLDLDRDVFKLDEAADYLRISTKTVVRLAKAGKIRGRQVNGENTPWRFTRAALQEYLDGGRTAQA